MASRRTITARVALASLIGVCAGAGAFTFAYAEGGSYLSDDPRACMNCHVMREHFDGWSKSPHHAFATCNDCHVPHDLIGKYTAKAVHGWRHSKAFTMQDFHEPIRITPADLKLVEHNCVRCHSALVGDLPGHGGVGGSDVRCVDCHSGIGHGAAR